MARRYLSVRTKIGVSLFVLFAMLSNMRLLKQTLALNYKQIGKDGITQYENRFKELKKELPSWGTVGYISDIPSKQLLKDTKATVNYFLTEYAVSPVVVDNSQNHPIIIGNFQHKLTDTTVSETSKFILKKDFGNGVVLFNNENK